MFRPRPCQFTRYMLPDKEVPTIEAARTSPKVRDQRLVKGGFTFVAPEQREKAVLRWVSPAALETLGLDASDITQEFGEVLAGQRVLEDEKAGMYPYAQNYSGYQFGNWAGQLGDGRAISLFEMGPAPGYELQLKGAGLTPYSRFADGKAVLRSSIREALASEAVHALGIPTTRALALTQLPETLARRERTESCAIVARFAQSWVRFGSFELYNSRQDRQGLRRLADYCIEVLGGQLGLQEAGLQEAGPEGSSEGDPEKNRYYDMWRAAALSNARMVAKTQAYGFLNGVLNTDNTSILGLSIDYGPFAFMDAFDYSFTPNHDDGENRYGFRNAPVMLWWNSVRLGEALGELIGAGASVDDPEFVASGAVQVDDRQRIAKLATQLIMDVGEEFEETYKSEYNRVMLQRLGLSSIDPTDAEDLIKPLLDLLNECELDYHMFFYNLGQLEFFSGDRFPDISPLVTKNRGFKPLKSPADVKRDVEGWLMVYVARLEREHVSDKERMAIMRSVNPRFVLRNWVLNDVIEKAENGDWSAFDKVARMALRPFEEYDDEYVADVPEGERNSVCGCSS